MNTEAQLSHTETHDDAPVAVSKTASGDRELAIRAVTINRPAAEVYGFYRDLSKAPLFMEDVERVEVSGTRSHWVTKHGEWDSEITKDVPNSEITWQAEGSSGRTTFEEIPGRGTVVTLTTAYEQSFVGKIVGKLTQKDPVIQGRRNLRRLKQLLETGEIATNARNQKMLAEENK